MVEPANSGDSQILWISPEEDKAISHKFRTVILPAFMATLPELLKSALRLAWIGWEIGTIPTKENWHIHAQFVDGTDVSEVPDTFQGRKVVVEAYGGHFVPI